MQRYINESGLKFYLENRMMEVISYFSMLCILILSSGHGLQVSTYKVKYLPIIISLILLPLSFRNLFNNFKKSGTIFFLIITLIMMLKVLNDSANINFYLSLYSIILLGRSFAYNIDLKLFKKIFLSTLDLIVLISLFFYLAINFTNIGNYFPTYFSINTIEYSTIYIFNFIKIAGYRNCGLFWEPGIFSSYLLISSIFILLQSKLSKLDIIRLILYFITIISTISLISVAIFLILIATWFFSKMKIADKRKRVMQLFSLFLLIYVSIHLLPSNEFTSKILIWNIFKNPRVSSIIFNLKNFIKSPLIGNTYQKIIGLSYEINVLYDLATVPFLLNLFGLTYLIIFINIIVKCLQKLGISIFSILTIFVLLIIANKEPQFRFSLFWFASFVILDQTILPNFSLKKLEIK